MVNEEDIYHLYYEWYTLLGDGSYACDWHGSGNSLPNVFGGFEELDPYE